ncbi:hypothetical protein [Glaesserella parasuis]|uniref:hypothetical protein n=2 Tax=Glaesserella parasuis TaxID=738 RepID=UPI0005C4EED6|nr:hypothetical protein [Glaesserella parasuis]MCT8526383.1 hypothetical protein [Glaesserella parasuis]MCT8528562.1 hypothetical protein [Glaesserella parasuis]MCT8530619.1 hypothetical protein [Glaesserella parasuis]MCT8532680.1 hypothetical protein [Glaesserella parasuis]MCT8536620.1 hypothetical protein [Glaesserella parasuis]
MKKSFKTFLLLATLIPFLISNSYAFPNNKETPFNGKDLPLEKYKQYEFPNASQVFFKNKNDFNTTDFNWIYPIENTYKIAKNINGKYYKSAQDSVGVFSNKKVMK